MYRFYKQLPLRIMLNQCMSDCCQTTLKTSHLGAYFSSSSIPKTRKTQRIWTVPNAITFSRMASSPLLFYLIINNQLAYAAGFVFVSGLSDALDGYIARRFPNQQSLLGTYLDPLADKVLITTLIISMAYSHIFPISLGCLIIGRDVAIVCVAAYLAHQSIPKPMKFTDLYKQRAIPIEMKASNVSKLNTACQFTAILTSLCAPLANLSDTLALQGLWIMAAGTTLASSAVYLRQLPQWRREARELAVRSTKNS